MTPGGFEEDHTNPLVSCIMTAYNYERFIGQAIESALAQDCPADGLELIVVDDGSRDGTPRAVEPYLDRVRYIRQENAGVISAANRGLAEARGELIAFLNADDMWPPDAVRRMVEVLRARAAVGLVYGDQELIDADGRTLHASYFEQLGVEPPRGRILGPLMRQNVVVSGAMMFRASLKDAYYPIPEVASYEDWYVGVRVAAVGEIEYIPAPLLRYRAHGDNEVLLAEGERRTRYLEKDLRFRRWMVATVEPGQIAAGDLVAAYAAFEWNAVMFARAAGKPLMGVVAPTPEERGRAEAAVAAAEGARERGDHEAAAFALASALALDPWHDDRRSAFVSAARRLLERDGQAHAERLAELREVAERRYELGGLVRSVDRRARRHVYGVGRLPGGELVGELGSLSLRPHEGSVMLRLDSEGLVVTDGYDPARRRPGFGELMRWVAAPLRWRGFGRRLRRAEALASRALEAPRHLRARPAPPERPVAGYIWADAAPSHVPLYSALHPVTGDQLLTRYPMEAGDMGYVGTTLLGYLSDTPALCDDLGLDRRPVPWASRFGLEARRADAGGVAE
jgi:glycosyltransferase involved in cell wall biosynthesis